VSSQRHIVQIMFPSGLVHRLAIALLALTVLVSTAPPVTAPAFASPCNCPTMQMSRQGTVRSAPAKQKNTPCNEMQNCVCGLFCAAAVTLPQQTLSNVSASTSEKLNWSELPDGSSLLIKPAIPPPIAVV